VNLSLPPDAVVPGVNYTPQSLPEDLSNYIEVHVSQIEDPGNFWLQLHNMNAELEALMVDIQWVFIFNCQHFVVYPHEPIFTTRRYASTVCAVVVSPSVWLSVRLSVTRRYCTKTAKYRIMQTTAYDSPVTLVCWCQTYRRNFNGVNPYRGAKWRWVGSDWWFLTNFLLYLRNGAS